MIRSSAGTLYPNAMRQLRESGVDTSGLESAVIERPGDTEGEQGSLKRLEPIELSAFLDLSLPPPDPVVVGLLHSGSLGLLHSRAGVGKTWLLLALGLATSRGMNVLGFEVRDPRPVLYVDGEMVATDMQRRLAELVKPIDEVIDHVWRPFDLVTPDLQEGGVLKIDTSHGRAEILRLVDEGKSALVILDNLSCLTNPEDDNSASSWSMVQELLLALRRRGVAVLVGHHSGKSGEQRGTSRRADILDIVLKLTSVSEADADGRTRLTVEFEKGRGLTAEQKQPFIACLEEHPSGGLAWSRGAAVVPVVDRVRQMLADGMSPGEIAAEARVNRSYCYRIQKEMLASGELLKHSARRPSVSPVSSL
jgi:AAA domain